MLYQISGTQSRTPLHAISGSSNLRARRMMMNKPSPAPKGPRPKSYLPPRKMKKQRSSQEERAWLTLYEEKPWLQPTCKAFLLDWCAGKGCDKAHNHLVERRRMASCHYLLLTFLTSKPSHFVIAITSRTKLYELFCYKEEILTNRRISLAKDGRSENACSNAGNRAHCIP